MTKPDINQAVNLVAEEENANVRRDMLQTVAVNILFIALLIGLYYWNLAAGNPLDKWISGVVGI